MEEEDKNISAEVVNSNLNNDTVSISANEYEEYKKLKENAGQVKKLNASEALSINELVSRELAEVQDRSEKERKLLQEATRINEIDTLASKYLSNHFNKDMLLSKGYSLDEILLAQRRELVRKYVNPDQIRAIAKIDSVEHIEGNILEQLLELAKVNIKARKNNDALSNSLSRKDALKFEDQLSISNPNFRPINHNELRDGIANFYRERQRKFTKLKKHVS
ncbi:DUF1357 family protein [Borrelia hispanica]|uniref:DUF1357 family protein n=3 Tax=Borrelia hispanica TaxID=40835 RepID=UPI0004679517|nr:DUF1357 family protein [Borrelia hispanica]